MTTANAQTLANPPAPRRPDNERPTPVIVDNADVAQPDAMRKSRAHCLGRGFLTREAHGEEANASLAAAI